jgi:hypothetical protein
MLAGQLEIQMLTNMAALTSQMSDVKGTVEGAMSGVEKAVGQAKSALQALGIGLSINAFVGMIQGSIEMMDKLNDLSKATGITVGDLAGLKLAANQSGSDLESVAASINKLSVNMGKDGESFKKLGVDAKDPLEAFKQLSDVFSKIEDPQTRAALGAAALGKSWAGAAPLLSEGSAKIQEMVDKGTALAGITKEMVEKADAFNDKLAELETATTGAKMKLADELLPAMTSIATAAGDAYQESGKLHGIWVALGGLGAFMFTDEFQTTASKVKELNKELEILYAEKKAQENTPAFGMLHRLFYGDNYLAGDIDKKTAEIKALKDALDKPNADAEKRLADTKAQAKAEAEAAEAAKKAAEFLGLQKKAIEEADKAREAALKAQDSFIENLEKEYDTLVLSTGEMKLNQAAQLGINGEALKYVEHLIDTTRETKNAIEAAKTRADQHKKESDAIDAYMLSLSAGYAAAAKVSQGALEDAQKEYDQFGLTKSQIAAITLARLQDQLTTKTAGSEAAEAVQKQIDAQSALIGVLQKGEARDAFIKDAEAVQKAWEHATKRISDGLASAITDALFDGRSVWDAFKSYLINSILEGAIKNALSSVIQAGLNSMFGTTLFSAGGAAAGTAVGAGAGGAAAGGGIVAGAGTVLGIGSGGFTGTGITGSLGIGASAGAGVTTAGVTGGGAGAAIGVDLAAVGSSSTAATAAAATEATSLSALSAAWPLAVIIAIDSTKQTSPDFSWVGSGALPPTTVSKTIQGYNEDITTSLTATSYKKGRQDTGDFFYQIWATDGLIGDVRADEFLNKYHGPVSAVTLKGSGGALGAAGDLPMTTLQKVLTELSSTYDAAALITAANTNWGVSEADVRMVGKSLSLPGYYAGGMFEGGLRIVGERGPELEATGPSRIFDAQTTASMLRSGGASNEDVVTELRAMRVQLAQLQQEARRTADATNGNPEAPMLTEVVV